MYTNIEIKLKIHDAEAEFTSTSGVLFFSFLPSKQLLIQCTVTHRNWPTAKPSSFFEWPPKAKGYLSRRCDDKKTFAEPLDLTDAFMRTTLPSSFYPYKTSSRQRHLSKIWIKSSPRNTNLYTDEPGIVYSR